MGDPKQTATIRLGRATSVFGSRGDYKAQSAELNRQPMCRIAVVARVG
jgi:hypothetical protein